MTFTVNPHILNPNYYDVNNLDVQGYQQTVAAPWARGYMHALGWVFFMMGLVVVFGLLNVRDMRIDRRRLRIAIKNRRNREYQLPQKPLPSRSTLDRMSTHLRSLTYHRARWAASVSLGLCALVVAGFLYPLLYIFTQRPYYALLPALGPPPLAGRAGMIAVAIIPFVLALGMKANAISLVTGVGHEKLNVLHRWGGVLMGLLAVVHAVPFLVEPVVHGGWGALREKMALHPTYWNGVGALACLFWLCVASLPFIRAWCYELFVHMHICAGVGFVGLLFWHCNNQLTSWHYLYATAAVWASGLLYRLLFRSSFLRAFAGERAHFTPLTDHGVMITIPTTLRWNPGQHVFIRIPQINPFDNHPFTVASCVERPIGEHNDLVLVFKPQRGFTKKVAAIARKDPDNSYRVFLDGPYGGLQRKLEAFETVLMIAGGSGITPCVAHLQELARKIRNKKAITRDVRIIWTVKHFESLEWFKDAISDVARMMPRNMLLVQYYVTQETPVPLPAHPVSATRDWPTSPTSPAVMSPMWPPPAAFPRSIPDEQTYERELRAMQKELGHPSIAASIAASSPPSSVHPAAVPAPPSSYNGSSEDGRSVAAHSHMNKQQRMSSVTVKEYSSYSPSTDLGDFEPVPVPPPPQFPFPPAPQPQPRSQTPGLPPLGDEVLLEFGRPPLRTGLRSWSEGFGRRTCVYVCGPRDMKVDVANAVAEMQDDIWMSDEREEVYLHTESFGW